MKLAFLVFITASILCGQGNVGGAISGTGGGNGGGAVSSVTGAGTVSCSPTTGSVVCTGTGGNTTSTGMVNGNLPVATGSNFLGDSGVAAANVVTAVSNLTQGYVLFGQGSKTPGTDSLLFWDTSSHGLFTGSQQTQPTNTSQIIVSGGTTTTPGRLVFVGGGQDASTATDGVFSELGSNSANNRQLLWCDSAGAINGTSACLRIIPRSSGSVTLDAVSSNVGTQKTLSIGNSTGGVSLAGTVTASGPLTEALGQKYSCTHGTNGTCGVATLASGTATVSTTAIAALASAAIAGDVVTLNLQTCSSCGFLSVGTVTAGISFVINSSNASDASNVYWEIRHVN